jgi:ABC-type transport system involved in multi-copper enzyme maturation permease subunit
MQFWALIVDSFRESLDRKIFWVLVVMTLMVAGAMACVGFEPDKITVMFGMWEIETDVFAPIATATGEAELNESLIASIIVYGLMDFVLGSVGVLLAIIATASFLPAFLERGAVDVVLAKPLSRLKLLIGKYLGSMVFMFVHAAFFVGLTFLIAGLRWGVWIPGYLLAIPLMILLFSYVYCISAWAAVRYRSAIVAIFLSVGAWIVFSGVQTLADSFEIFPSWKENRMVYNTARVARWVIPKTQDVTYLAARWSGARTSADIIPEVPDQTEQEREMVERATETERARMNINPVHTIGSSLLFEAVVVMLAVWQFSRRDF